MGNCKEVVEDLKKHLTEQKLFNNVQIVECTGIGKSNLRIAMDVVVEINGVCEKPEEHHKSVKDRILRSLDGLIPDFQIAEAFSEREETGKKTRQKIVEGRDLYDKLFKTVSEW